MKFSHSLYFTKTTNNKIKKKTDLSEKLISFLGYNNTFHYIQNIVLSTDGNKITRMRRHLSEMSEKKVSLFVILYNSSLNLLQLIILFMGKNSLGGFFVVVVVV